MSFAIKSFRHAKARQPEIIRTIQKDKFYSDEFSNDVSDVLRFTTSPKNWIKYNQLSKLISQIIYHGFGTLNNLQSLGEEYTGIIQVDNQYVSIPSKIVRLVAIILEFGGEALYLRLLKNIEKNIDENDEILPEAKDNLKKLINFMRISVPYIKAIHRTIFYFGSSKNQISKRFTGINFIVIRHWLKPNYSLFGYKLLGYLSAIQLSIIIVLKIYEIWKNRNSKELIANNEKNLGVRTRPVDSANPRVQCILCLEQRKSTSVTTCGHLFCWNCILDWLNDHDECPICRDSLKKSNIIQLQNFL